VRFPPHRFQLFWLAVAAGFILLLFLNGKLHASTLSVSCQVVAPAVSKITYTHLPNNVVLMDVYY